MYGVTWHETAFKHFLQVIVPRLLLLMIRGFRGALIRARAESIKRTCCCCCTNKGYEPIGEPALKRSTHGSMASLPRARAYVRYQIMLCSLTSFKRHILWRTPRLFLISLLSRRFLPPRLSDEHSTCNGCSSVDIMFMFTATRSR